MILLVTILLYFSCYLMKFNHKCTLLFSHYWTLSMTIQFLWRPNLPEEDKSRDMIFNAWVFSFKVIVTWLFGFFTRDPSVDCPHFWSYDVVHRVETGDFYLTIYCSKVGAQISWTRPSLNTKLRLLPIIRILQKPNARSTFLSYLIRSTIAKNNVFKASWVTSLPIQAP